MRDKLKEHCGYAENVLRCFVHLDSPTFISHPHFFNGDPVLQDFVLGLHPSEEEHGLFIDIHPVSVHTPTHTQSALHQYNVIVWQFVKRGSGLEGS